MEFGTLTKVLFSKEPGLQEKARQCEVARGEGRSWEQGGGGGGVGGGPGSCVRLSGRKELGWAESGKGGGGLGCHLAVVESERTAHQECGCTSHPLPSCPFVCTARVTDGGRKASPGLACGCA